MGRNEVSQSLLVQVRVLKNREMLLNMHALTGTFIKFSCRRGVLPIAGAKCFALQFPR